MGRVPGAEVVEVAQEIGCERVDRLIAGRGTAAVGAEDEARLRAHLAICARCAELAALFDGEASTGQDDEVEEDDAGRADLGPGAMIAGRYRLEHRLGRGGMGVVCAAVQVRTGQPVAIKLLHRRSAEPRARRRFLREARAACAVHHPNVVQVHDVVDLPDGAPAIVMELLTGHSLQRRFDRGPMPLDELCHVLSRVAAAVGAAHAVGIIHRDLKPENVFLARLSDGEVQVKVLDFGVAKRTALAAGTGSGTLTRTGALVGTPYYMSPEQALGEGDLDARTDLWALGILLYQGLSGVLPTRGDNLGQVIKAVVMSPIAPIDQRITGLPADLVALIARLLSKEREARPRDMGEVRAVLERHASARIAALVDLDPATEVTTPATASASRSTADPTVTTSRSTATAALAVRSRRALGAVVIAFAAMIALSLALTGRTRDPAASSSTALETIASAAMPASPSSTEAQGSTASTVANAPAISSASAASPSFAPSAAASVHLGPSAHATRAPTSLPVASRTPPPVAKAAPSAAPSGLGIVVERDP